jgi:glycosyl transferase family 25
MNAQTLVISLPDAVDRRAAFTARARGAELAWSFFDARRELGPGLTYDPADAIVAKGRPLYPAELGCYASHFAAWTDFLESGASQLIVLEDDTIVDWTFLAKVARTDLQASGVGFLRLFAKRPCAFRRVRADFIEHLRYLIEFLDHAWGTQAYVITRAGAERLARHCRVVSRPIDIELDRSWAHGVPNLCVFPFPVVEEASPSSIGTDRYERHEVPAGLVGRRRRARLTERARRGASRLRRLLPGSPPVLAPLGRR